MKKNKGFTLVELMVVVAIMGILASVAYPKYTHYVIKAKRSDAKEALLIEEGRMEEFYQNNDTYIGAAVASADSPDGYYKIALSGTTLFGYLLTATRTPADDPECLTLTLDQLGQRKATGTLGDECWRR